MLPKGHLIFSLSRKWSRNRSNEIIQFLFLKIFTSCPNVIAVLEGFSPKKSPYFFWAHLSLMSSISWNDSNRNQWEGQSPCLGVVINSTEESGTCMWRCLSARLLEGHIVAVVLGKGCMSSQLSSDAPCYKGWTVEGINTIKNTSGT